MFFTQLHIAFESYFIAYKMLHKHKLWPMIIYCGLIYLVLIALGAFGIYKGMHHLSDYFLHINWIENFTTKYKWLSWIATIFIFGIYVLSFLIYFSIYKYILLTVASPLYAYISERTATALTGQEFQFNFKQLMIDIVRGVKLSIRNLFRQSFLSIVLIILSFIPIIGLISAALFIVLDSYYYGFAMLDYNFEREKLNAQSSIAIIRKNKGLAIGNGLIFYCLFLIPVIGIVIGAPLSAMAATISLRHAQK
jgi:CysZ protein